MTEDDVNQETAALCVFATPTGERWCECPVDCRVVVCVNFKRNAGLSERSDGASFHTCKVDEYNELFRRRKNKEPIPAPDGAVFVRSRYCCRTHCVDFKAREK